MTCWPKAPKLSCFLPAAQPRTIGATACKCKPCGPTTAPAAPVPRAVAEVFGANGCRRIPIQRSFSPDPAELRCKRASSWRASILPPHARPLGRFLQQSSRRTKIGDIAVVSVAVNCMMDEKRPYVAHRHRGCRTDAPASPGRRSLARPGYTPEGMARRRGAGFRRQHVPSTTSAAARPIARPMVRVLARTRHRNRPGSAQSSESRSSGRRRTPSDRRRISMKHRIQFTVNGEPVRTRSPVALHPAAGAARATGADRHEERLRGWASAAPAPCS